jgi:hypothetical protein
MVEEGNGEEGKMERALGLGHGGEEEKRVSGGVGSRPKALSNVQVTKLLQVVTLSIFGLYNKIT